MMNSRWLLACGVAAVSLVGVGCSKKVAAAPPPPPAPAAAAPTAAPTTTRPATRATDTAPSSTPAVQQQRYPNAATRARIDTLLARIEDAYFDYDKHTLRPDAVQALQADSTELRDILKDYPDYKLTIEGHCDERGSAEYNMALGQERAQSAKDYLVQVGIPSGQLATVSYGKEKPICDQHDEACWQKNRRIHIVAQAGQPQQ
jgi:peptidoglycan-associated lipoprotein